MIGSSELSIFRSARPSDTVPPVACTASEETHLQNFCEAALDMLPLGSTGGSVLFSVLPSLAGAFRACDDSTIPRLRDELRRCEAASEQLRQLALLHCGEQAEGLHQKLKHGHTQAARVIDALEALRSASSSSTDDGEPARVKLQSFELAESQLKQFCEATLDLLRAGQANGSVFANVLPSLVPVLSECGRAAVDRLREENSSWEAASVQLMQLAFSYSDREAESLCEKLERTQAQVARVIDSLDALHARNASPHGSENISSSKPASAIAASETADEAPGMLLEDSPAERSAMLAHQRAAAFLELGLGSHRKDDLAEAEAFYGEALKLDQTLRLAAINRGRLRLLRGAADQAMEDFTLALTLNAADPVTYGWRGDALVLRGRVAEALQDYNRSLELAPDDFTVRYNRAVVLRQLGRLDESLAEFDTLADIKPDHGPLYLNRGLIWQSRGAPERALIEFRTALQYRPNSVEAQERLKEVEAQLAASRPMSKDAELQRNPSGKAQHSEQVQSDNTQTKPGAAGVPSSPDAKPSLRHVPSDHDLAMELLSTAPEVATSDSESLDSIVDAAPEAESSEDAVHGSDVKVRTSKPEPRSAPARQPDDQESYRLDFRCPDCGEVAKLPWNKLQVGKVLSCPRCRRSFTSTGDGKLVAVIKNKAGRWSAVAPAADHTMRNRMIAGSLVSAALICVAFFGPGLLPVPRDDAGLPQELEPRSKVFALAWLKGDYRTMRRLTNAEQGSALYMWCMENPPPPAKSPDALERDVQFKVVLLPSATAATAKVQVLIDGLKVMAGRPVSELPLFWRQDGENWMFQPGSPTQI